MMVFRKHSEGEGETMEVVWGEMQLKCSRAGKQHRIMLCLQQAAGFVWDAQIPAAEPLADLH